MFGKQAAPFGKSSTSTGASAKKTAEGSGGGGDDDDDEGDDDGSGAENGAEGNGDDADEDDARARAAASAVPSGEEGETQLFQARVKLFRLVREDASSTTPPPGDSKTSKPAAAAPAATTASMRWKELGCGPLRLNAPSSSATSAGDSGAPKLPRLIMRREGVLKLLLNGLVRPDTRFDAVNEKAVRFTCESHAEDATGIGSFTAKFPREDEAKAFLKAVEDAKKRSSA